jgi:signal transduction histidine kinase
VAEEMGLDTLRERVEMLGGRLQAESSPGRGTRVVFDIPLP